MKVGDLVKWFSWDQRQQLGILMQKQGDTAVWDRDGFGVYWEVFGAQGLRLHCREEDFEVLSEGR